MTHSSGDLMAMTRDILSDFPRKLGDVLNVN